MHPSRRRARRGSVMVELTAAIALLLTISFYLFNATYVGVIQVSKAIRSQLVDTYLNNDMEIARRYSETNLNLLWPADGSTSETDDVALTDPAKTGFTAKVYRTRATITNLNPGGVGALSTTGYTYTTMVEYTIGSAVYQKSRQTVRYLQ